jgi:hypothetical protein
MYYFLFTVYAPVIHSKRWSCALHSCPAGRPGKRKAGRFWGRVSSPRSQNKRWRSLVKAQVESVVGPTKAQSLPQRSARSNFLNGEADQGHAHFDQVIGGGGLHPGSTGFRILTNLLPAQTAKDGGQMFFQHGFDDAFGFGFVFAQEIFGGGQDRRIVSGGWNETPRPRLAGGWGVDRSQ